MAEKIDAPEEENKEVLVPAGGLQELDLLDTENSELVLSDGRVIEIGPMRMKQIREFLTIGTKFLQPLQDALGTRTAEGQAAPEINLKALAEIDQEAFMECIRIGSGLSVEELDKLYPTDFTLIVGKIMVMNLDFFAQTMPMVVVRVQLSVVKVFNAAMEKLQKGAGGPTA